MFRFIRDVNANRISASTGKPDWFELSKKERKESKDLHRMKSPNVTKEVFERLNSFLGDQADTVPLRTTYIARATFAEEDAPPAESPDNASSLFEEDTHASLREQDPHNTGRRNNKWQRNDKYEKVREVLEERSEAFFAKFELMQREEMRERRRQHAE
ncbi:Plasma membrane protein [Phytophthora cinnamomi]|uniref:Plasma membrane protein n=1 Tax=Phytophthora cinnamomi TaxID=4785 RepID=UPI00355A96BD|nr:Plasma membrane protein [Phytophthora cinnamomi]